MVILCLWIQDRRGATAIEYGLLAAGIALAIAISVNLLGDNLYTLFYDDLPKVLEH